MNTIVVICQIYYSSYSPINWYQYRDTLITKSEVECQRAAETYHHGTASPWVYDMSDPVGKVRIEQICGLGAKDCKTFR